jgi:hypothetical protein
MRTAYKQRFRSRKEAVKMSASSPTSLSWKSDQRFEDGALMRLFAIFVVHPDCI